MKKILLFILLSISIYGQNPTRFPYGVQITGGQTETSETSKLVSQQPGTGTLNYVNATALPLSTAMINALKTKADLSTGLIKNGLVTTNADPTKFNITAGIGIITNFDNPEVPTSTIVSFPAFTGITPTYLNTSNITYVAITLSGSTPVVLMQATAFDNVQRRNVIALGAVIHSNLTTINLVNNISAPTNAVTNQLHDLYEFIGALNLTGNKYTANGANLSLDKTAGTIGKLGVNFANNWRDPNRLSIGLQSLLTFRYRTQNGAESGDLTVLNPAIYDLANVLTAVPSNKFSIQTVTLFQTGMTRIQYGQNTYNTLAEAEAAILTRSYVVENNIAMNGIARAYIILKNTATSLQNASDAKIVEAQKFGGIVSGGAAITDSAIIAALGYTPANDVDVVKLTGNQTVLDKKAFNKISVGTPTSDIIGHPSDSFNADLSIKGSGVRIENTTGESFIVNTTAYSGTSHWYDANVLAIQNKSTYLGVLSQVPAAIRFISNTDEEMGAIGYQNGLVGSAFANSVFLAASMPYYPGYPLVAPTRLALIQEGDYLGSLLKVERLEFNSDWSTKFKTPNGTTRLMIPVSGRVLVNTTTDNGVDAFQVNGGVNSVTNSTFNGVKIGRVGTNSGQIVIGDAVTGYDANSTVLGNTTTTNTAIRGRVIIGTTTNDFTNQFQLTGNAKIAGNAIFTNNMGVRGLLTDGVTEKFLLRVNTSNATEIHNGGGGIELKNDFNSALVTLKNGGNLLIGTTTDDSINKLQVNGSTKTTALTLTTAPTTSAGTYDFVTRNTSTGAVEKVLSNTIATIESPSFTGTPTAPTATVGTNTTQIATTAFVQSNAGAFIANTISDGVTTIAPSQNAVFDALALKASLSGSSTFTGQVNATNFNPGAGNYTLSTGGTGLLDGVLGASFTMGFPTIGWTSNTVINSQSFVATGGTIRLKNYTVATLPTGVQGDTAYVTDATAPTYLGLLIGGGSIVTPVFYNGTAWVSH